MRRIVVVLALVISLTLSHTAAAFECRTKFTFQIDTVLTSGIAISGNTLFFGDSTGKIYALDKNSGSLIWSYKANYSIYGTPSVIDDRVTFAQGDGTITCLKISDGSLLWNNIAYENVSDSLSDGTTPGGGMVYVSKSDGKLYALDDKSGHIVWTYEAGPQGLRNAPAYDNGLVFLGEYDGRFSIIDAETGERINGGGSGGAVNTPSVKDGNVYFSSWDGSVQAVRIKGVVPLWNTKVNDTITTSPAISENILAIGTGRGAAVALDTNDGKILWRFETNAGGIQAKPLIANGLVFIAGGQGNLYVMDAKTGNTLFNLDAGYVTASEPAFSEGVFYFGGRDGITALE